MLHEMKVGAKLTTINSVELMTGSSFRDSSIIFFLEVDNGLSERKFLASRDREE